jgi:colanic acid biosynthesis glycosyl transferase WcaI
MNDPAAEPLLVVTPTFAPEKVGTPHYIADLVRGFRAKGELVEVVTNQPYYPAFERFPGYGRATRRDAFDDVPIRRLATIVPKGGNPLWRGISELNFLLQALALLASCRQRRRSRVLAVSPGTPFTVITAVLLTRRRGRCVAVVHDIQAGLASASGAPAALVWVLSRLEVWALNQTDEVTVLSSGMAESLQSAGVRVPVEIEPLWATVTATDVQADPDLVLYSGNLGRKQGVALLIEVADLLATLRPTTRMLIRGQGSERIQLERDVLARGLSNVTFADLVEEADLALSLGEAAVHLVPQLPEGAASAMPSKIYNILAVGRPVVAAAAEDSGIRALSLDVDAIRCVYPGDAETFAKTVVSLLNDPIKRESVGVAAELYVDCHRSRWNASQSYLSRLTDSKECVVGQPVSGWNPT